MCAWQSSEQSVEQGVEEVQQIRLSLLHSDDDFQLDHLKVIFVVYVSIVRFLKAYIK